jgi:hypothetical protein
MSSLPLAVPDWKEISDQTAISTEAAALSSCVFR